MNEYNRPLSPIQDNAFRTAPQKRETLKKSPSNSSNSKNFAFSSPERNKGSFGFIPQSNTSKREKKKISRNSGLKSSIKKYSSELDTVYKLEGFGKSE